MKVTTPHVASARACRLVAYFTRVDVSEIVLGLMCAAVGICVLIDTTQHRRVHAALAWSGALVVATNVITCLVQTAD
jgi:FtsH-binding integral membrane protein